MANVGWIFDKRVCIDCLNKIPDNRILSLCVDCLCLYSFEELAIIKDQIERTFNAYEGFKSV